MTEKSAQANEACRAEACMKEKIERANAAVLKKMTESDPVWMGMAPAKVCVPELAERPVILHAGPEIAWENMCAVQQQGGVNGALHEGFAKTETEAREKLSRGEIEFHAGNDYHIVCSGSGITTPSMAVNIVTDRNTGVSGYCAPFEGPNRGGLGGWGVFSPKIHEFLQQLREELAPAFTALLRAEDGLPLGEILAQGIVMGDEFHSRQEAAGVILKAKLMKRIVDSSLTAKQQRACVELLYGTVRFFHPLNMAAAMAMLEGIRHERNSTIVTAMAGNGVTYGIKLAGTGNAWFTAPAPKLVGAERLQIDPEQILPWIGDSSMMETAGFGGFAAAAAPEVLRARGEGFAAGIAQSREMMRITAGCHTRYPIPALNGIGAGVGIDFRRVLETGVCPKLHGGMISRDSVRLGAGTARVPLGCFEAAAAAFQKQYIPE